MWYVLYVCVSVEYLIISFFSLCPVVTDAKRVENFTFLFVYSRVLKYYILLWAHTIDFSFIIFQVSAVVPRESFRDIFSRESMALALCREVPSRRRKEKYLLLVRRLPNT
jgi:hypothetical protein